MLCHMTNTYDRKTTSGFVNEAFAAAMSSLFVKVVEKNGLNFLGQIFSHDNTIWESIQNILLQLMIPTNSNASLQVLYTLASERHSMSRIFHACSMDVLSLTWSDQKEFFRSAFLSHWSCLSSSWLYLIIQYFNSRFQVASHVVTDNFSSPWLVFFCEPNTLAIFVTASAITSRALCLADDFFYIPRLLISC